MNILKKIIMIKDVISFSFFSDINYFHCVRIVELLKETEAGKRNIFGGYSSKRMKVSEQEFENKIIAQTCCSIAPLFIDKSFWSYCRDQCRISEGLIN